MSDQFNMNWTVRPASPQDYADGLFDEPPCGLWWILSTVTTAIGLGIGLGAVLFLWLVIS